MLGQICGKGKVQAIIVQLQMRVFLKKRKATEKTWLKKFKSCQRFVAY